MNPPRMNVYEVEIENAELGYRLVQHLRAESKDDAIARAVAHWNRPVLSVEFRRPCKPSEVTEQLLRDQQPAYAGPVRITDQNGAALPAMVIL